MTKNKTEKRITSHSELIHEYIISKNCFELWMQSRSSEPKHPEGAFRRTLNAHLRGADGRSPFQKDVEQSLLKQYRAVNKQGKPIDPFAVIFGRSKKFKSNGKGGWRAKFEYPYGYHEKLEKGIQNKSIIQSHRRLSPYSKLEENQIRLENLLKLSQDQMDVIKKEAEKASFHFSFPAVAYLVQHVSSKSYFFSQEFIFPTPKERSFTPICHGVLARNSEKIAYMDRNFENTFGRIPHLLYLSPTIVEFFHLRRLVYPEICSAGHAWHQGTILYRGERFGFKSLSRLNKAGCNEFFLQVDFESVIKDTMLDRLLL
eukprot:maker-scaffold_12-snap-gene-4.46-mRNA-1 protein AED:0.08 eAED:0.12 QI:0/0.33/0.5/1/1/1/4/79/314